MFFFGTGRPFTMEEESWSKGIFPPYPATLYGYLKSVYLEGNMSALTDVRNGGENDPTKDFNIHKFALTKTENNITEILYPIPYCFVLYKKDEDKDKELLQLVLTKNDCLNNNPNSHVLVVPKDGKVETLGSDYYFTKEQMTQFLNGEAVTGMPIKITVYLTKEQRIGIAKNLATNTTQEGKLYRIEFNHLSVDKFTKDKSAQIDFVIEANAAIPDKHLRSLGGEGKKAILQKQKDDTIKFLDKSEYEAIKTNHFLYFATPVILNDLEDLTKYCTIKTIAIRGYEQIGGWDMAKRKPKESRSVFPAGTVVFIDFKDEQCFNEFKEKYPNKIGQDTQQGFGEYYIGTYKS